MTDLDALADAEEAKKVKPCWVCSIPEHEWVDKALKEGRSMPTITTVLVKAGHQDATLDRIKIHKAKHVR